MMTDLKFQPVVDQAEPAHKQRIFYSNHNVGDIVSGLTAEDSRSIVLHYFWRALHCPGAQPGDVVFVSLPVEIIKMAAQDAGNDAEAVYKKYLNDFAQIAAWMKRATGINYVITDSISDEGNLPIGNEYTAQESAYYPGGEHKFKGELRGASIEQVEALDHKGRFGETMQQVESMFKMYGAYQYKTLIPQEQVVGVENVVNLAAEIITRAEKLYSDVALHATAEEAKTIAEKCFPGVVVRMTMSGGGFGTIFMAQAGEYWKVTLDKEEFYYPTKEAAFAALRTAVMPDQEYVVSRYVDVVDSPSLGIYVNDTGDQRHVYTMPFTIQFMDSGSCIGGSSQTAQRDPNIDAADEKYIQLVAQAAVQTALPDKINESMHFGFDVCQLGEGEQTLAAIIARQPELSQYQEQVGGKSILVESNTRYTSLSLSVQPVAQFIANQQGKVVDWELISAIYGVPNAGGEVGGFAVWDYMGLPTSEITEEGHENINSVEKLLNYIDRFNAEMYSAYGIFLLPRIGVELKKGHNASSLVIGMVPTTNAKAQEMFKSVVEKITRDCGLTADIGEYIKLLVNES